MFCVACIDWCREAASITPPGYLATTFCRKLFSSVDEFQLSASRGCQLCSKALHRWKVGQERLHNRDFAAADGIPLFVEETSNVFAKADDSPPCVVLQLTVWNPIHPGSSDRRLGDISVQVCAESLIERLHQHDSRWKKVGDLCRIDDYTLRDFLSRTSELEDLDTGSDLSLDLIWLWWQKCLDHCCSPTTGDVLLPSRVIDLGTDDPNGNARLIECGGMQGQYISLSHCWGPEPACHPPKTTTANLEVYKKCLPFHKFPKTFRDAARICQRLQIRYLWIDSLCIIQDSTSDWDAEAAKMCSIYQNSQLTIAASYAKDCSVGCFSARDGHLYRPCELPILLDVWKTGAAPIFLTYDGLGWELATNPDEQSVLDSRAWTFQERLLSTRVLSFEKTGLAWSCPIQHVRENTLGGNQYDLQSDTMIIERSLQDYKAAASLAGPGPDHIKHADVNWAVWEIWEHIIRGYTERTLTNKSDKLAALFGVATVFVRSTGDEYLAGVWKSSMIYDLCWKRAGSTSASLPEARHAPAVSPSWSWASVQGPVTNELHYNSTMGAPGKGTAKRSLALIHDATVAGTTSSQQGTVTLSGYLLPVTVIPELVEGKQDYLVIDKQSRPPRILVSWLHSDGLGILGSYSGGSLSVDKRKLADPEAGCLSLDEPIDSECRAYVMALVNENVPDDGPKSDWSVVKCIIIRATAPGPGSQQYTRIGFLSMPARAWFGNARWKASSMAKWYTTLEPFRPDIGHGCKRAEAATAGVPPLSKLEEKEAHLVWQTVTIV